MKLKVDYAIKELCHEIEKINVRKNWLNLSDEELLFELVLSILGSQVPYEAAFRATKELQKAGMLNLPGINISKIEYENKVKSILLKPIYKSFYNKLGRYRFYISRANFISETIWKLKVNKCMIRDLLATNSTTKEIRKTLINLVKGFGPKQSSHFLRNIGFDDNIAILDTHVLYYMNMHGIIKDRENNVNNLKKYEKLEDLLREFLKKFDYSMGCVDRAIWIVMRVYKREYLN